MTPTYPKEGTRGRRDFTDEFGFRSFRIVQGTAQLSML
jgi:hypothetical protein